MLREEALQALERGASKALKGELKGGFKGLKGGFKGLKGLRGA